MIYVDDLLELGAPGKYRGAHAAQAERVGAANGHRWCHLFTDAADLAELHAFAAQLGMRREWLHRDHYDLTPGKRAAAVRLGARELSRADAVTVHRVIIARRKAEPVQLALGVPASRYDGGAR